VRVISFACQVDGGLLRQPPLRDIVEWLREVGSIMMDGVVRHADIYSCGDSTVVDDHAAVKNAARQTARNGRRQAHRLIDAGAEILAVGESWAVGDMFRIGECGAYFCGDSGEGRRVVDEIEEGAGHGGGGGVGASDDEEVGFPPKFGFGKSLSGFWVTGVEKIVEEVLAVTIGTKLLSLYGLGARILHILGAFGGDLVKEYYVEVPFVHCEMGAAL